MDIEKEIKKIMIEEEITQTELAKRMNTSQGNIGNKLKRNNPSIKDLEHMLDVLGYKLEINFIKK